MDTFSNAIAVVSAICLGMLAISIFVMIMRWLGKLFEGNAGKVLVAQTFITKDATVTVSLSGNETIENLKFVGFTQQKRDSRESVPYNLLQMAVFEKSGGERIYIPTHNIRFITELRVPSVA